MEAVLAQYGGGGGSSSGGVSNSQNAFRLSLASGLPVYAPQPATPASTDTVAETVTFSVAPGWVDGTIVTPATTVGGLTNGTRYFLHRVSSVVFSFHTTVADALTGANPVNLTANITTEIRPSGISNTTIYLTPYSGNTIALYNGASWFVTTLTSELSLALGTLVADTNYDVFLDYNNGTPQLVLSAAWTGNNTRSDAIAYQDGVLVKASNTKLRLVGGFRTNSTTTTIQDSGGIASQVGGKLYVSNVANRRFTQGSVTDFTNTWTWDQAAYHQANAASGNKVEFFDCLNEDTFDAYVVVEVQVSNPALVGIGLDSTTVLHPLAKNGAGAQNSGGTEINCALTMIPAVGYHAVNWIEYVSSGSANFHGQDTSTPPVRRGGLNLIKAA